MINYDANKLPVCISYTAEFQSLVNHCCSTLAHPNIEVHLNLVHMDEHYAGFRSPGWFECLKRKMQFFYDFMSQLPLNAVACSMDGDIQLFNAAELYNLKQRLEQSPVSCFGQAEHYRKYIPKRSVGELNGGFLLVQKTPAVMKWLQRVLQQDYNKKFLGDQEFINHFIREQRVPYQLLPPQEFMHGGPIAEKMHDFCDPARLVLHHATWSKSVEDKQTQMNVVRRRCNYPHVDWSAVRLTNPNMVYYVDGAAQTVTQSRKRDNALVIARYNENLAWVEQWAHKLDVFIYNKGAEHPAAFDAIWRTLPNVGREAHTYLTHIIENYAALHDVTIFLQGRIDDCHAYPPNQILRYIEPAKTHGFNASQMMLVSPPYWNKIDFMALPKYAPQVRDGSLKLYAPGMLAYVNEHVGKIPVNMPISYCGCFAASADAIRRRPRGFYEKLLETVSHHTGPEEAHFLERLWAYIFSGTAYVPHLLKIAPEHHDKFLY